LKATGCGGSSVQLDGRKDRPMPKTLLALKVRKPAAVDLIALGEVARLVPATADPTSITTQVACHLNHRAAPCQGRRQPQARAIAILEQRSQEQGSPGHRLEMGGTGPRGSVRRAGKNPAAFCAALVTTFLVLAALLTRVSSDPIIIFIHRSAALLASVARSGLVGHSFCDILRPADAGPGESGGKKNGI